MSNGDVRHRDVDASELRFRPSDHPAHGIRVADIGEQRQRVRAELANLGRNRSQRADVAMAVEHDIRTRTRQSERDAAPDVLTGARHERRAPTKRQRRFQANEAA